MQRRKRKRHEVRKQRLIWLVIVMASVGLAAGIRLLPVAATQPAEQVVFTPQVINHDPAPQMPQATGVFIRSYQVNVTITDQIARTRIKQEFVNDSTQAAEGTYVFPLPPGVTISDLVMIVDGVPYSARILEKQEARQVYTEIVQEMRDPALLEYLGTNAIQANVFPIPPGGERILEIEYSQLIPVEQDLMRYVYPLRVDHLSQLPVGQLSISVQVNSAAPIASIYSPTHPISINQPTDTEFVVGFETTNTRETTDFSLYYGLASDDVNLNLLTYRESAAEDGFFLALIAPPVTVNSEQVIAKDVILVLDQSGSMLGEKWEQARDAAQTVLANLNPADRFNVIVFNDGMRPFATGLQPVNEREAAQQWLETLGAGGGTHIDAALQAALDLNDREHPVVVMFLTDGLASNTNDVILQNVAARETDNVRFFTFGVGDDVNTFLLDELSLRYHGTSVYVRPGERIDEAVSALYNKISAPVLTDLALEFEGVTVYDVYPAPDYLPDLFAGSQLMVLGRYWREDELSTLKLTGQIEGERRTFEYNDLTFPSNAGGEVLIPRLWAQRRIGDLLNAIRLRGDDPELVDSIVRLSIRYGIVTPYTSFIITEDDIFTEQGREDIQTIMQPTATALALQASGNNAVNAAQQAGGMFNSTMAATMAPDVAFLPPTVTALPTFTFAPLPTGTPPPVQFSTATATGTATMTPTRDPNLPTPTVAPEKTVRTVGDRTFVWRNSVWIDTLYDPEEMTPEEIVFLSDAYFELLDSDERVAEFYALGERVIFVLDGQAYEVISE